MGSTCRCGSRVARYAYLRCEIHLSFLTRNPERETRNITILSSCQQATMISEATRVACYCKTVPGDS
jgi:hypothetical protein